MDKEIKKFLKTMVDEGKKNKDNKEQAVHKEQILVLELINEQRNIMRMFRETMRIWNKLLDTETASEYFSYRHNIFNIIINPAISPNISSVYVPDNDEKVRKYSKGQEKSQKESRKEASKQTKSIVKLFPNSGDENFEHWYTNHGVITNALNMLVDVEKAMDEAGFDADAQEQVEDLILTSLINLYTYLSYFYHDCGYLSNMSIDTEPRKNMSIHMLTVVKDSPFMRPQFFRMIYEYLAYQAKAANMPSSLVEEGFPTNSLIRYNFTKTLNEEGNWKELMKAIYAWSLSISTFTDTLLNQVTLLMEKQSEPYFQTNIS